MRTRVRHTSALALGSALSGLLAYVFFAVVSRALGASAAAPVSVLWTYWSFAGAALTFPIQHWASRAVAVHGGEAVLRRSLPSLAGVTVAVAAVATVVAWLLRDPLFGRADAAFPLLAGAVSLGAAAMGLVRGVLSARQRFTAVATGLFAENAVRCVAVGALAAAGSQAPVAYGLALLAGYVVVAQPSAYALGRTGRAAADSPLAFLGAAAGGQLLGQTVLTGGPVALALAGGAPADVTTLFAALALFRAPYTLALGVVAQVTGWLTHLVVERRRATLRATRRWLVLVAVVGSAAAAAVGALLGPWLLRLVFGAGVDLDRGLSAVVAAASTLAIANLVTTLLLLAHGRASRVVAAWSLALIPGAVCLAVPFAGSLARTCWAFLVIELVALVLLLWAAAREAAALDA